MEKKLLLKFSLSLFAVMASLTVNAQINSYDTIISGGVKRTYILYVPAIYNASKPTPLIFNFHGLGSSDAQQEVYADFRPIADTADFIEVLPQGLTNNGTGETGWNNFGTVASANADIEFVSNLIDSLKSKYNINTNRIYSTGYSNGGFMSYDLACFLTNRFTAIASVCGSMISSHVSACKPSRQIPIMEIHGTKDPVVSYSGTSGILTSTDIDTLVKFWVNINKCTATPVVIALPNTNKSDSCTATQYDYNGSNCNTVELYKVINGGHSWPGSSTVLPAANYGYTNEDFNASVAIWKFFSLCKSISTGVNEIENNESDIIIYPNPASDYIKIQSSIELGTITVTDMVGKIILQTKSRAEQEQINIKTLPDGVYFVTFLNNGIQNTKKFIVIRK